MHKYKPKTSQSNNSIIYVSLPVNNTLHFMTFALVIMNYPLVSE